MRGVGVSRCPPQCLPWPACGRAWHQTPLASTGVLRGTWTAAGSHRSPLPALGPRMWLAPLGSSSPYRCCPAHSASSTTGRHAPTCTPESSHGAGAGGAAQGLHVAAFPTSQPPCTPARTFLPLPRDPFTHHYRPAMCPLHKQVCALGLHSALLHAHAHACLVSEGSSAAAANTPHAIQNHGCPLVPTPSPLLQGRCARGDVCPMSHNLWEMWWVTASRCTQGGWKGCASAPPAGRARALGEALARALVGTTGTRHAPCSQILKSSLP